MRLDVIFLAIFVELITVELSAVVHYKGVWHSESGGDILVDKSLHVLVGDSGQCLCLSPFREVIHGNYYISALPLSWRREGTKEIESPLGQGPWAG